MQHWTPPKAVDEYLVVHPLGQGTMGQVYLGHDTLLDRPVAVKFIRALNPDATLRERFLMEARAIARLQHPNVVSIYRVSEAGGRPYLVSEFVKGESLEALPKPVPWERARDIALGLGRGLAAAHRRNVLHRDIKPANVLLGEDGEVKLLDFGLAKLVDPHAEQHALLTETLELSGEDLDRGDAATPARQQALTGAGMLLGTPLYMPPETWRGEPATCQSDIYSLGAVIFELCTGATPHTGLTLSDLRRAVLEHEAAPLHTLLPGIDRRFAAVVDRCLKQHPADRFGSGEELCQVLGELLAQAEFVESGPRPARASVPGLCPQPPKAAYDSRWYVSRQAEERSAADYLGYPGMPVVVLGPELFGKTWFIKHALHQARCNDDGRSRVVAINLDLFERSAATSLDSFLHELALHITSALPLSGGHEEVERIWRRSAHAKANLNWLMERSILPAITHNGQRGRLILAIDRADAIWGCPFQDEFFGLLRAWAESAAEEEHWPVLRLMLAVSTTPALLIQNPSQSPFNLTEPIRLGDLSDEQVAELAQRYELCLTPEEFAALRVLVGGHPYLVRLALYTARQRGCTLSELLAAPSDPFAPFLERCLSRLRRQPGLLQAFLLVAQNGEARIDRDAYHRLESAGLLLRDDRTGACRLRYALYLRLISGAER